MQYHFFIFLFHVNFSYTLALLTYNSITTSHINISHFKLPISYPVISQSCHLFLFLFFFHKSHVSLFFFFFAFEVLVSCRFVHRWISPSFVRSSLPPARVPRPFTVCPAPLIPLLPNRDSSLLSLIWQLANSLRSRASKSRESSMLSSFAFICTTDRRQFLFSSHPLFPYSTKPCHTGRVLL